MRRPTIWLATVVACIFFCLGDAPAAKSDNLAPVADARGVPVNAGSANPGSANTGSATLGANSAVASRDAAPLLLDGSSSNAGDSLDARFGAFYHGVGSFEQNTYDINASFLTPRLNFGLPGYLAYALPRFQIGGALNLAGRTSFGYAGIALDLPITKWMFFEPFFGGAVHNGSLTPTPTLSGLGCPFLFHLGTSLGFPVTEHWTAVATFEHLSNGRDFIGVNCGTNQIQGGNQGLNNFGVSVDYAF